ncbi:MAG: ADP-ribosylglycohydrolase family protein [Clostridiaceae bacterium]|nr:ADP-ribosylglycohydrolase family protein [Clostridiaceae bacterium]
MYGAILGDMIGAPYEFDRGSKTKDFPLFCGCSQFTDDSVMTIAVAEALLDCRFRGDDDIRAGLVGSMRKWGGKYPDAGYGGRFRRWLRAKDPEPYGSCGNGSAMRVSSAGWLFDTPEETRRMARLTAEVTHDHPEGIKGAEATASAIFLARTGRSKDSIRDYVVREFGYDLSRTCDEIRPTYCHNESCQKTVPEAITAFLEGTDLEDVIRTAVSLGGDCDTLACIAGSIAEAFYGVPERLKDECRSRLPKDMLDILCRFDVFREHGHGAVPDPRGQSFSLAKDHGKPLLQTGKEGSARRERRRSG